MGPRTSIAAVPVKVELDDQASNEKAITDARQFQNYAVICTRNGAYGDSKYSTDCKSKLGSNYGEVNSWTADSVKCQLSIDSIVVKDTAYNIYKSVCSGEKFLSAQQPIRR